MESDSDKKQETDTHWRAKKGIGKLRQHLCIFIYIIFNLIYICDFPLKITFRFKKYILAFILYIV